MNCIFINFWQYIWQQATKEWIAPFEIWRKHCSLLSHNSFSKLQLHLFLIFSLVVIFTVCLNNNIFQLGSVLFVTPLGQWRKAICYYLESEIDLLFLNFSYFVFAANAVPCRVAFKSGKEHHLYFQAISSGISGWLVLAEEQPSQKSHGLVRVVAPLAGCNVCIVIH